MIGIPLMLVTITDLSRFVSMCIVALCRRLMSIVDKQSSDEHLSILVFVFILLVLAYPLIGGVIFWTTSSLTYLDSVYFSLITIFTIGEL
jgi:hypothetical protein